VVGTAPAQPTAEPATVTPPAGGQSDLSKAEQSRGMPNEGENNSHSTTAPVTPQKANGVNATAGENTK
jgi:hypothetical protein